MALGGTGRERVLLSKGSIEDINSMSISHQESLTLPWQVEP